MYCITPEGENYQTEIIHAWIFSFLFLNCAGSLWVNQCPWKGRPATSRSCTGPRNIYQMPDAGKMTHRCEKSYHWERGVDLAYCYWIHFKQEKAKHKNPKRLVLSLLLFSTGWPTTSKTPVNPSWYGWKMPNEHINSFVQHFSQFWSRFFRQGSSFWALALKTNRKAIPGFIFRTPSNQMCAVFWLIAG